MKAQIWKTLGIIVIVILSWVILSQEISTIILCIYASFLISVFFWKKSEKITPVVLAALIPIIEAIIVVIYYGQLKNISFIYSMENYSCFYEIARFPGYILLCIILPFAFYETSKIWNTKG